MSKGEALLVSTMNDLPGFHVTAVLGLVRGVTVRSTSVVGSFVGSLEAVVGGRNRTYVKLCEETRQEATEIMIDHAVELGADAILGMRYDANDVQDGITEVLAYGTAVQIERV